MRKVYLDETEATECLGVIIRDAEVVRAGATISSMVPICYITREKDCYLIAKKDSDFLKVVERWKTLLIPCTDVEFFASKEEASARYEFLNRVEIEQSLPK